MAMSPRVSSDTVINPFLNELYIGKRDRWQTGGHTVIPGVGRGGIKIVTEGRFSAQSLDEVRAGSVTDNEKRYPLGLAWRRTDRGSSPPEGAMNPDV
jgi:hypothetical protein